MSDIKIEDNFLDQNVFDKLQVLMLHERFDWHYKDGIVFEYTDSDGRILYPKEVDKNKFQFVHIFYLHHAPCSEFFKNLIPILDILDPVSIWRIKANLLTKTSNISGSAFHVDMGGMSKEKLKHWKTSIFYVNTNDGYTEFEDGTKVESVANRMISFPANLRHRGTSCTDEKRRIIINFNYFTIL